MEEAANGSSPSKKRRRKRPDYDLLTELGVRTFFESDIVPDIVENLLQ